MLALPSPGETAALAVCATASAGALLAEAALRPESQIFGHTLIAGHDPAEVALTFDDGPNDSATSALLDLFAEHNVQAAFFMIGRFVAERPALTRRVHAAGHVVGNHTQTHPWLAWQTPARIREELRACNAALEDALGAPVRYFRPPHGARRPAVARAACELGLVTVQWNVTAADWLPIGADGIARRIAAGMGRNEARARGSNILLHDGYDQALGADRSATVAAVERLLTEHPRQGKRFVGLDAWE